MGHAKHEKTAMDRQSRAQQGEAAPCQKRQQRQPEQNTLRGGVPEEDFAEEGLHGVVLTLCWQVCALSFLSLI